MPPFMAGRLDGTMVRGDLVHAEPPGFTSELPAGGQPQAFALFFGCIFGSGRSHGLVFCMANRLGRAVSPG